MHEDSPPPFIVIRTPARPKVEAYDRALELVGLVQKLLDSSTARFHLKDRLDRCATTLVFELSRAKQAVRTVRWRHYRRAHEAASDCATILDILVHQKAAATIDLESTRTLVRALVEELSTLG
jgi:hypothetical protein